jgi:hypothetical protein
MKHFESDLFSRSGRDEYPSPKQFSLQEFSDKNQLLIEAVEGIIHLGSCAVSKPVRAGFTTSCIYACERKGLKLLVIQPTVRILKETVSKATDGNSILVLGNNECPFVQEEIKKNPILAQLPITLSNCDRCNASGDCEIRAILRTKDFDTVGLTYAKLKALMLSQGKTAGEILNKLSLADVVLLDEAHLLAQPPTVSVPVSAVLMIPNSYRVLKRIHDQWLDLCQNQRGLIQELMEKAEKGHSGQHLSREISNQDPISWKELKKAWVQLRKMAVEKEMTDEEILILKNIIAVLSSGSISLGFVSKNEGKTGEVYFSAGQESQFKALKEFLTTYVPRAKHLYVSGTLNEPYPGYFNELSGKEIKPVVFPDLRNATKKMTLIPDTWKLNSHNFDEKLAQIIATIKAINDREKQPIYLLAPNRQKATILKNELGKIGLKNIVVDFYRSDRSIGVAHSERICIAIGFAEIPANSCDCFARGRDEDERWLDSRRLRRQGVDAATWQAVNRVRDPEGKVESKVYFIGCRVDQVQQVATWGSNRRLIEKEIKEKKGSRGQIFCTPVFEVQVENEIDTPKIFAEGKHGANSERRSVKDYLKGIEYYKDNTIKSENHCIPSIDDSRENAAKNYFYNFPSNNNEISSTASSLLNTFFSRTDCYARQSHLSTTGKWGFYKVSSPIDEKMIKKHVAGEVTLGVYEISLSDTVTWCADDIDSHNGETDAREKVGRLVSVLKNHGIPFWLEASGSPDSYHLWILLSETKTYNAYRFIRQINSEANVECEAWPKQKSLQSNGAKYGNLLKLPICYHNKSGGRSAFLDADTFEPLEGPIQPPGRVHLLEVPELSKNSSSGMPKISKKSAMKHKSSTNESIYNFADVPGKLRYCMQKAFEDKISLTGSEGHHLRLAIAAEGKVAGMSPEDVAKLFQNQKDYNYDISLKKSEEVWTYDYSPWSCDTLRDKCGSLVKRYCEECLSAKST